MPKFRKIPVEIEAVRVKDIVAAERGTPEQRMAQPSWLVDNLKARQIEFIPKRESARFGSALLSIHTLNGWVYAYPDEWIICGVDGELYPCTDSIFQKTYQAVEEETCSICARGEGTIHWHEGVVG